MLWGFFKKVVIADSIAPFVEVVYSSPSDFYGLSVWIATLLFTFQVYGDFSGYSDIAIGTAKLFNFRLTRNFRTPLFSKSMKEFWGRWHITLSTWFRDYLYIPLGGNRVSRGRWYYNLFVTFLVSGLWHGASWAFAIWGGLNGVYLIAEAEASRIATRFNLSSIVNGKRILRTFSEDDPNLLIIRIFINDL